MNQLLPDIEDLANCQTHAERCDWLLRAPLSVLLKYEMTIRNRLMHARFAEGIIYLEVINEAARTARNLEGGWSEETWTKNIAAYRLMTGAVETPAPVPDHSITEI